MGATYTKEDEDLFVSQLYTLAQTSGLIPDVGIDESLLKYSGLDSAAVLKDYTSQLQSDLLGQAPGYVQSLGSSVASLNGVPNAVGLGALIISFILDLAIRSAAGQSEGSTLNMLRRVFAEEKASSVRDSMDECIKRLSMHLREPSKALQEIERLEKQLSDQLTRLKNSMLHDKQMSSRAMKQWANGAAFHSQMLIHAARLEAVRSREDQVASISTVVDLYQQNLQELLKKYKTYKGSTITLYRKQVGCVRFLQFRCTIYDQEFDRKAVANSRTFSNKDFAYSQCDFSLNAYVRYLFNTWEQVQQLEEYFSDLKKNINELIIQHQEFSMKNS